ncbi:MAG: metal-dependent hydrolase [Anaerolineae bacterium]|nr:metal-dependent hydrolase [Anaerolineae bacterium]MCL4251815.1 metal-dependent hydrolase [Anaerolineae bacterium]
MMGVNHAAIGQASAMMWALSAGATLDQALVAGGISALAAILPDIDHPSGQIRQRMGIASVLLFWLKHRGITHTLLAFVAVGVGSSQLLPLYHAIPVIIGYGSHLVADAMTRSGIPFWYPLYKKPVHLLPSFMRLRTNGLVEHLIGAAALFVILRNIVQ